MARRTVRDYKKPFYICSFDADEILFNLARGTVTGMNKYDGSLPVSLDSLEIQSLCGRKEYKDEFPAAFFTERTVSYRMTGDRAGREEFHKTFCNAVINVDFTGESDFTDVDRIREDYDEVYAGGKDDVAAKDIAFTPPMMSDPIERDYRDLLLTLHENRKSRQETAGRKNAKAESSPKMPLKTPGMLLDKVTVSVSGTQVTVSARIANRTAQKKETGIRLFVCGKDEDDPGKDAEETRKILGIFEPSPVAVDPRKTKTRRLVFDIRDLMGEEESGTEYYMEAGEYTLFADAADKSLPLAVLELKEEIRQPNFSRSPEWLDETEWEKDEIPFPADDPAYRKIPYLAVSAKAQKTFKECGKLYDRILDVCCDRMINRIRDEGLLNDSRYLFLFDEKRSLRLKMRYVLYEKGFDALCRDGVVRHFVSYKRSASKSKSGSCLFIWDRLYDHMIRDWTWMGFDLRKISGLDLTSVKAYEALTLSSIENEFFLDPESILLLDSPKGQTVRGNRRIVCKEPGDESGGESLGIRTLSDCASCDKKACREDVLSYRNAIWDGQALLDESVFEEIFTKDGKTERHGMVLLRNHFFKACAFHTRISEYYKAQGITTVYDMFGKGHDADRIRLIITTDSLKFLKISTALFGGDSPEKAQEMAFTRWKKHVEKKPFGVVKKDEGSRDRYHVGYQILNTLPLRREEMAELFASEKEYIEDLWKNDERFVRRIPKETAMGRFMTMMYERFPLEFVQTDQYIEYKRRMINDIKKRIRRGRLKLDGDMYTLCSMPYEMLVYSGLGTEERASEDAIRPLLAPDEAYIGGMRNGEQITLCRYPHMSSGSVCVLKQRSRPEFTKWFRTENPDGGCNIVFLSPWESNIMVKLGGADFDSDTALFVKDRIFREAAEKLLDPAGLLAPLCKKYAPGEDGLPVAQAGGILKGDVSESKPAKGSGRENGTENSGSLTGYDLAMLDHKLSRSQMNIGSISNNIQLFNCYLWEALFRMKDGDTSDLRTEEGYVEAVYECILKLAVLNELEIDRAKHKIDLSTPAVMRKIMDTEYKGVPIIESLKRKRRSRYARQQEEDLRETKILCQPAFLYEIKRDRGNTNIALRGGLKKDRYWNCPPDQLSLLVSELRKPREIVPKKEISYAAGESGGKADTGQAARIERMLKETLEELDRLDRRGHTTDDEMEKRDRIQSGFAGKIAGMKSIREKTMDYVFRDTMCRKKGEKGEEGYWDPFLYRNRYRVLGLLFMASDCMDLCGKAREENVIRRCFEKIRIIDA